MIRLLAGLLMLLSTFVVNAQATTPAASNAAPVIVRMQTNLGLIVLQLDPQRAPETVDNFVTYVKSGYYDGMIFNRVIAGFMAQGGGYDEQFHKRRQRFPVKNESGNGLLNVRGSIAMAREDAPNSATAEFYINFVDNPALDGSDSMYGYTVFGHVIQGMDVVDQMAKIKTGAGGPFPTDVPKKPIVIEKATLGDASAISAVTK